MSVGGKSRCWEPTRVAEFQEEAIESGMLPHGTRRSDPGSRRTSLCPGRHDRFFERNQRVDAECDCESDDVLAEETTRRLGARFVGERDGGKLVV
jgi:hypothetical protein